MAGTTITLAGTISSLQNNVKVPVEGISVRAVNETEQISRKAQTDKDGKYTFADIKTGQWQLSVEGEGYRASPPTISGIFDQDTDTQDFSLSQVVRAGGTVYHYGSNERIRGAVVKATDEQNHTLFALTDDDGDFLFSALDPGKWTLVAMDQSSFPGDPEEQDLQKDKTNLRFELFRRMGTADQRAGKLFFYVMIGALAAVVLVYILLHIFYNRQTGAGDKVLPVSFWSTEPLRYIEVFLWGLAGILVSKIIESGSYLRWKTFYREGIVMHISHIVTVPLLVLVTVLLLSQITLELTLASENTLKLDLSNAPILVAVSFVLGTVPWRLWGFIRATAEGVTKRIKPADDDN